MGEDLCFTEVAVALMGSMQGEYGDEQADAGRNCRTRLARPNSQARTETGEYSISLFS